MSQITTNELAAAARRLDAPTFRVWAWVRANRTETGTFEREQAAIAAALSVSIPTVTRAIRAMKDAGILRVIRETHRATVYHVADADAAEESAEDQQPETGSTTSYKIGYVKHDGSSKYAASRTADHSPTTDQKRLIPQHVRSKPTDPAPPPRAFSEGFSVLPRQQKNTTTTTEEGHSVTQDARGGGGGVSSDDGEDAQRLEAFALLAGLKSLTRRRELARKHTPEEIREALAMARRSQNVRDAAALAASFLTDGSAAEALREQTRKAAARQAAAQKAAAAAPAKQDPPPFEDFTAHRRRLQEMDPARLAGIVAAVEMRLTIDDRRALERFIAAQKPPENEVTICKALHWTMRDDVAARIDQKTQQNKPAKE